MKAIIVLGCLIWASGSGLLVIASDRMQFDLPAVALARPVAADVQPLGTPSGWKSVAIQLRLSCFNSSVRGNAVIDECLVQCRARDASPFVIDYAPRTAVASDVVTPIQIKQSQEKSSTFGVGLNGSYGNTVKGNLGMDSTNKQTSSVQYDTAAPVSAVVASGTFDRGHGVYFKLRWTRTQVLEGERLFELTLCVPTRWRGGLLEVEVTGSSEQKSMVSWEPEAKKVASSRFIVAAYLQDDPESAELAYRLAGLEQNLRSLATTKGVSQKSVSLPDLLRHVAMKVDLDAPRNDTRWLELLLFYDADPHVDKSIVSLPVDTRAAALTYINCRTAFESLSR
jgi:hypothetical protein